MDLRTVLAESTLFSRLTGDALDALAKRVTHREIAGGELLFSAGDPPGALYIVANGRLRALLPDGSIAGDIGRGEPIGEIGMLTGEPRGATVYAVRDSELLVVSRDDLAQLMRQFPDALLEATRVIIRRLRQNQHARKLISTRSHRGFALVAATPDVDVQTLGRELQASLSALGPVRLIDAATVDAELGAGIAATAFNDEDTHSANTQLLAFLNAQEAAHARLVYVADGSVEAWSRRCMRQADLVLVVAKADQRATVTPMIEQLRRSGARAHVELVLQRSNAGDVGDVLGWRELLGARAHYFLRPQQAGDLDALARQITGRGIGLVLGGGGARGFAHIGLLRALRELQIPVDIAGGSSMGAFIAALAACGRSPDEMMEIARDTFVRNNYLNDYLFPTVAMIRGRKFTQRLKEIFREQLIEQLPTPYFCVSTNLTSGSAMMHDRGLLYLWLAASMAVPGFAPPVAYKGELLADGAVVNSLPTDLMQSLERGPIIASDVSTAGSISAPGIEGPDPEGLFNWATLGKRPSLISIMFRTATLTSESGVAARAARANLYIRMPVAGVGLFDWKMLDEVSERGYRYALEKLAPMREALFK